MVELLVNIEGNEPPRSVEEQRKNLGNGEQWKRCYFKGDVVKVLPKNWHKYFQLAENILVIRVRNLKFISPEKNILTESMRDGDGNIIARRRHYVDLKHSKIWGWLDKRIVTVWNLDGLILDKEK
jgi:hypothetical protein